MTRETEGETERGRRRYKRGLFDQVARLYEATRPGYPPELAEFVAATAGIGAGAAVLENIQGTSLSWPEDVRRGFTAELKQRLGGQGEVGLTLEAAVTMAHVRKPASGG